MRQLAKSLILSTLGKLGYELVPVPKSSSNGSSGSSQSGAHKDLLEELRLGHTMRTLHAGDAVEIEELYRKFVFPGLPENKKRADNLYNLIGTTVGEGLYVVNNLHEALRVPGDICEFGVAQGATSRLIGGEIMSTDRNFWLFDSFEGLPEPTVEDKLIHDIFNLGSMKHYKGTMASPESEVLAKLDAIGFPRSRTRIKKGWVKDVIKTADIPAQVAFAYVDFDFYDPIKDALEFLDGRMPVGGRIVVDDYGFFSEGAQLAVDRFVQSAGGRFKFEMPLPFAGHFCILSKIA